MKGHQVSNSYSLTLKLSNFKISEIFHFRMFKKSQMPISAIKNLQIYPNVLNTYNILLYIHTKSNQ